MRLIIGATCRNISSWKVFLEYQGELSVFYVCWITLSENNPEHSFKLAWKTYWLCHVRFGILQVKSTGFAIKDVVNYMFLRHFVPLWQAWSKTSAVNFARNLAIRSFPLGFHVKICFLKRTHYWINVKRLHVIKHFLSNNWHKLTANNDWNFAEQINTKIGDCFQVCKQSDLVFQIFLNLSNFKEIQKKYVYTQQQQEPSRSQIIFPERNC